MRRVVVVGSTGSGKTSFARLLATRLDAPHVELDALHWGPNWTQVPDWLFRERVTAAVRGDGWVVDGNYRAVRDLVWPRADTVVWLDYSFVRTAWQLVRRTVRRCLTGEELWSGNRERFWTQLGSRDSLLLWFLKTYGRRRREYSKLFVQPEFAHLQVVRLRSPRATRAWLSSETWAGLRRAGPSGDTPPRRRDPRR